MSRLTTEEFIRRAKNIHGDKYDYSLVRYKNLKTKVKIKCNICGNVFEQIPYDHLKGHGCPICGRKKSKEKQRLGKEEFIKRAKKMHGDKYDYSLVGYKNWNEKVKIKCNKCGRIFVQKVKYHLRGSGCPYCGRGVKTTEEFIEQVRNIFGDIFDFSKTEFSGYKSDVIVTCKKHNIECVTKAEYLLKGSNPCRLCRLEEGNFRGIKLTTEEFIRKAKLIHGDKYDYSLVQYKNWNEKVKIICPKHGIFEQLPGAHLTGSICPKCSVEKSRLTNEEFIKRVKDIHGDRFDYSKVNYVNYKTDVTIICKEHNCEINYPAELLLRGYNPCPKCNSSIFERQVIKFLKNELKLDTEIQQHVRILDNYEIDIYLPEYKLGIECHGIFWHSLHRYNRKNWERNKRIHKIKADIAERKRIKLLQIFEYEWLDIYKRNIWKDIICAKLGIAKQRIFARKCKVVEISYKQAEKFLNTNHLHGAIASKYNYGLVYDGELIAVATFGKDRFTKNSDSFELYRFASKIGIIISGGFSKLINYFVENNRINKLITYADRRYSFRFNNVYEKVGFTFQHVTEPNYRYLQLLNNNKITVESRLKYQKYKMKNYLNIFDESLTEIENMILNDYFVIYDAGNNKFLFS